MKNIFIISAISALFILNACIIRPDDYPFERGSLPSSPVNLTQFNTVFDDYNSAAPYIRDYIPFCFSTNRNSNGNEFDIICQVLKMDFSKMTGILEMKNLSIDTNNYIYDYDVINIGLEKIKSTGNELGPNLITEENIFSSTRKDTFTLLYATNVTGNYQINYISNRTNETFSDPKEVRFLNSNFDDLYPSFNKDKTKIYFCSNRNGNDYNFHYVNLKPAKNVEAILSDTSSYQVFMDSTLSSASDDKCPFIFENTMVFASNRSGGFGGYDLYYSIYNNGAWSAPVNCGEKINTRYDEFRPILLNQRVSDTQKMMIFSSNRPGGLGGFDLYYTGIPNQ